MSDYREKATKIINDIIQGVMTDYRTSKWLIGMDSVFQNPFDVDPRELHPKGLYMQHAEAIQHILMTAPIFYVPMTTWVPQTKIDEFLKMGSAKEIDRGDLGSKTVKNAIFYNDEVNAYCLALPNDPLVIFTENLVSVAGRMKVAPFIIILNSTGTAYDMTFLKQSFLMDEDDPSYVTCTWGMSPIVYELTGITRFNGEPSLDIKDEFFKGLLSSTIYVDHFFSVLRGGLGVTLNIVHALNKAGETFTIVPERDQSQQAMNNKRVSKGKKPIFETRTIIIEPRTTTHTQGDGTRGGWEVPEHDVVGHYHNFWIGSKKEGTRKLIEKWVEPFKRGNIALGRIEHNYAVK